MNKQQLEQQAELIKEINGIRVMINNIKVNQIGIVILLFIGLLSIFILK